MSKMPNKKPIRLMIIHTALKLYLDNGFSAITNRRLCQELGINMGSLLFQFPTKESLLTELVKELCSFQSNNLEERIKEGKTSLLAYCLELTVMASICDQEPVGRELLLSAYKNPIPLSVIRNNDTEKTKKIFGEFCSHWEKADFISAEFIVSGIEYAALTARSSEEVPLSKIIYDSLSTIMKIYNVPDEIRINKLEKIMNIDFQLLGKETFAKFKNYVNEVNEHALEDTLHS